MCKTLLRVNLVAFQSKKSKYLLRFQKSTLTHAEVVPKSTTKCVAAFLKSGPIFACIRSRMIEVFTKNRLSKSKFKQDRSSNGFLTSHLSPFIYIVF